MRSAAARCSTSTSSRAVSTVAGSTPTIPLHCEGTAGAVRSLCGMWEHGSRPVPAAWAGHSAPFLGSKGGAFCTLSWQQGSATPSGLSQLHVLSAGLLHALPLRTHNPGPPQCPSAHAPPPAHADACEAGDLLVLIKPGEADDTVCDMPAGSAGDQAAPPQLVGAA